MAWFTPNETEALFFAAGESFSDPKLPAEKLLELGPQNVVLKLGSRGAYVATAGGVRTAISPFPVEPVDTTAAGDCFNGAFASALCLGCGPVGSARFAAAAAALCVTRPGAQPAMPTASEVEAVLDKAPGNMRDV